MKTLQLFTACIKLMAAGLRTLPMQPPTLADQDFEFDAPVEGATFGSAVIRNRSRFAVADGGHAIGLDLVAEDQVAFDDFGAALPEAEVIEFGTDRVGMAFDLHGEARVILDFLGGLIEDATAERGQA